MSGILDDLSVTIKLAEVFYMLLIIGGLVIGGIKYLAHIQTDKVKKEVSTQLQPAIDEIKGVKTCLESQQRETAINIKYLDKAIMHLQAMEEDRQMNDYRLK